MDFEHPKKEPKVERTSEELRLHNLIQVELMKRWAKKRELSDHDAAIEWAESRHFSKSFSDLVKEHPELYQEYQIDPLTTLLKIEAQSYGGEELKKAA